MALSLAGHALVVAMLSATFAERRAPPKGGERPIEVQIVAGSRDSVASQAAPAATREDDAAAEAETPIAAPDEAPLAEAAPETIMAPAEELRPPPKVDRPKRAEQARAAHKKPPRERHAARAVENGREAGRSHSVASTRGGGQTGPSGAAGTAQKADYRALALAHLARFKRYPGEARDRSVIGKAVVRFTLSPRGDVLAVSLARSSGAASLDAATLAMVRRAAPFPPMPAGASSMSISAGVNYNLR